MSDDQQTQLSEEEQRKIMEGMPWGTFVVLVIYALGFVALWGFMYFTLLVARGPVN